MSSLESHPFVYTFPSIERDPAGNTVLRWEQGMPSAGASLEVDTNPMVHMVQCAAGAFTREECRRIVELGDALPAMEGLANDARERYRDSEVGWLAPGARTEWLYNKLAVLFDEVNSNYRFELLGLVDPLQYTVYRGGHHFDWHIDVSGGAASLRKLSLTLQLSDDADYGGGDLEIVGVGPSEGQRAIGTVTVFPSFLAHRVAPVTSGVRRSLVAWACGPSFR